MLATAWIALSESKEENGCVRLIPGSNNQVSCEKY
jgi:ectoine hydroxylase-related dioxygenase (phytanoyl-CoA dioxygenase family)